MHMQIYGQTPQQADLFEFKHLDTKWSYATNGSVAKAIYIVPDSAYISSLHISWNTVNKCTSCQKISSVLHITQTSSFFSNHSVIEWLQSKPSNLKISFRSNFPYITQSYFGTLGRQKEWAQIGRNRSCFLFYGMSTSMGYLMLARYFIASHYKIFWCGNKDSSSILLTERWMVKVLHVQQIWWNPTIEAGAIFMFLRVL